MKYHAIFVIFEKQQIFSCLLLQIIGNALKFKISKFYDLLNSFAFLVILHAF